ncbi:MAG TPA: gliding motility protein GldC [Flavobacteriales bacterium]|nr:gliding motility protein GldC [Flavobacteriales bacterium]HMR28671.1 gliding motility protein GldC [Flavobacteriales bacterium]
MRTSEIRLDVQLDENHVPERIHWEAEDGGARSEARAVLLALWDEREQNTLRIDLWTKTMSVDDMKRFFHQNILTMADTFERATGEGRMAAQMRDFGAYFAEHMLGTKPDE